MSVIDIKSKIDVDQSLPKIARTATETGTAFDISGYNGVSVIIDAGTWTNGGHTFEIQDSDDNSTFTAVADASLDGSEPVIDGSDDGGQKYRIGYLGNKRYLRVNVTVTGSPATGAVIGALIVKGFKNVGLLE